MFIRQFSFFKEKHSFVLYTQMFGIFSKRITNSYHKCIYNPFLSIIKFEKLSIKTDTL